MKRSPIARSTKRIPTKRAGAPRKSRRIHSPEYMARCRSLPCSVGWNSPLQQLFVDCDEADMICDGEIHAHHAGERGLGQKASDLTCIPLCQEHHRNWHDCDGPFADWSKEKRQEFAGAAIEYTQRTLAGATSDNTES